MRNLPAFITFTGVDDKTDIQAMADLAALYPIEWGVLFSPKRQGKEQHPRYPSLTFVKELTHSGRDLRLSAHLCGGDARQVIEFGRSQYDEPIREHFDRVQINTTDHVIPKDLVAWARGLQVQAILQCRDVFPNNDDVSWLYDASGGRGITPAIWPASLGGSWLVGYAGGLNPGNVAAAVAQIQTQASNFWIDLETGARDGNDRFSIEKCRAVCEAVYGVHA